MARSIEAAVSLGYRDRDHLPFGPAQGRGTAHEMVVELIVVLERVRVQRVDLEDVIHSPLTRIPAIEFFQSAGGVVLGHPLNPSHSYWYLIPRCVGQTPNAAATSGNHRRWL